MKKISLIKSKKFVTYTKKNFCTDKNDENAFKLYYKVREHCHYTGVFRGATHIIWNLRYKTPKEIPIVFLNGFAYDYHFIIKQLAKEFWGQFECFGENTGKYITFSVSIKKDLDNSETITYKLKFIDSFRFLSTSLSSLFDNLSEKRHSNKCKSELDYMSAKHNQLIFSVLSVERIIIKIVINN